LPPQTADTIIQRAQELLSERSKNARRRLGDLQKERAVLLQREMALTEHFVASEIESEAYKTATSELRANICRLEEESARLQQDPTDTLKRIEHVVRTVRCVWELQHHLNESRQIELLRTVFKRVVLRKHGVAGFVLNSPFDVIAKSENLCVAKDTSLVESHRALSVLARQLIRGVQSEPPKTETAP
jgi:predicted RNase H-like nuclease (RuvC/YqgF family)